MTHPSLFPTGIHPTKAGLRTAHKQGKDSEAKQRERALGAMGATKRFVRPACEALAFAPTAFADRLAHEILDALQAFHHVPDSLVAPLLLSGHPRLVARALRVETLGPAPNDDRPAWEAFLASHRPYPARPETPPTVLDVRQWTELMRRHGPTAALQALASPTLSGRHALQAVLAAGSLHHDDGAVRAAWADLIDLAVAKDDKRQRVLLEPTTRALVLTHAQPAVAAHALRGIVRSFGHDKGTMADVAKQMAQHNDACGVYALHLAGMPFAAMRPYASARHIAMPTAVFFENETTGHRRLQHIARMRQLPTALEGFLGNRAAQQALNGMV